MARAAAMARSASSSWADGGGGGGGLGGRGGADWSGGAAWGGGGGPPTPAMRQSPMYLSTVPPWSATMAAMRRKATSTLPATASGSASSAIVVNPTTSA